MRSSAIRPPPPSTDPHQPADGAPVAAIIIGKHVAVGTTTLRRVAARSRKRLHIPAIVVAAQPTSGPRRRRIRRAKCPLAARPPPPTLHPPRGGMPEWLI